MIGELRSEGYLNADVAFDDHVTQGLRSAKNAHKYSTAWNILHDFVSIDDLRETPKDLDGNVWYKDEWDIYYCLSQITYIDAQKRVGWLGYLDYLIKKNASDLAEDTHVGGNISGYIYTAWGRVRDVSYAMEGYYQGDPYRLPNSRYPEVSKHVTGWAVDISRNLLNDILWEQGGYTVIDEIARKYWLIRPYNNQHYVYYMSAHDRRKLIQEWWHFERVFSFR